MRWVVSSNRSYLAPLQDRPTRAVRHRTLGAGITGSLDKGARTLEILNDGVAVVVNRPPPQLL